MGRFESAIKWYIKGGLFHPFYIFLSVLPTILLLPYKNDPMFNNYLMLYVDLTIIPLVALMVALHVVREPQVMVFEINIFRSLRVIYVAKLLVYLMALSIGFIPLVLLLFITGKIEVFLIPLMQRILTYVAIVSISLLLNTPKSVLLYLLVFFFILPYAPPILLNRARMLETTLDPVTSIVCYVFAPIASSLYDKILGLPLRNIQIIASLISILIIVISYFMHSRKEYQI